MPIYTNLNQDELQKHGWYFWTVVICYGSSLIISLGALIWFNPWRKL